MCPKIPCFPWFCVNQPVGFLGNFPRAGDLFRARQGLMRKTREEPRQVHGVALGGVVIPIQGILDVKLLVEFLETIGRHERAGPQEQPEIADIGQSIPN